MFRALARWWRRRRGAPPAGYVEPSTPIEGRVERIVSKEGYVRTAVHVDRPCVAVVAEPGQRPRCQENRGGDFYTDCHSCTTCDQIFPAAPDLLAYVQHPDKPDGAVGETHCAFLRQPRTPEEIDRAIWAMCGSEVCGIRYGGRDPEILRRIAAQGRLSEGTADHPLGGT